MRMNRLAMITCLLLAMSYPLLAETKIKGSTVNRYQMYLNDNEEFFVDTVEGHVWKMDNVRDPLTGEESRKMVKVNFMKEAN